MSDREERERVIEKKERKREREGERNRERERDGGREKQRESERKSEREIQRGQHMKEFVPNLDLFVKRKGLTHDMGIVFFPYLKELKEFSTIWTIFKTR